MGVVEESSALHFDVNVKLEEKERKSGSLVVGFVLTVGTKPSVAKFEVEGMATLKGKNQEIEKLLEVDPKTKIPLLLHGVYQRVFMATFLLATLLSTSYPPPDLLFSGEMNKPRSSGGIEWKETEEGKVEGTVEEKKTVKPKLKARRR